MICSQEIRKIESYLNEYVFDGQFLGLYDRELIKKKYLNLIAQKQKKPVWVGQDDQKFFCTFIPQNWDSEQLHKIVGRIHFVYDNCKKQSQLEHLRSILNDFELVYLRLSRPHLLINLIKREGYGFREYAEKVMLRLAIDQFKCQVEPDNVRTFSELEIKDKATQLSRIAKDSFRINRFSRDRNFPSEFNSRVYESWLQSCLANGENILCSFRKNKLLGFIIVSDTIGTPLECFNCSFVELIAVDKSVKRKSVGSDLLKKAALKFLAKNIQTLHANTDSQNLGAIKFFQAAGFRQFNSIREYHWWRNGKNDTL